MKRAILVVTILFIAVISTACINNFAVQELNNKAQIYLNNGDYESAIDRLQASLDLDNTIFETHYNLGVAYVKSERYSEAIKTLTKAIELNKDNADTYYSLAVAQESYANEMLELNENNNKSSNQQDDDESLSEIQNKKVDETALKMTPEQRKLAAIELYTSAISSYKKYLEIDNKAKDTTDIQNQIKSIEEELEELGQQV